MFRCSSDLGERTVPLQKWDCTNKLRLPFCPRPRKNVSPHPLSEKHWNIGTDVKLRGSIVKEHPHGYCFSTTYRAPKKRVYQVFAKSRSISIVPKLERLEQCWNKLCSQLLRK